MRGRWSSPTARGRDSRARPSTTGSRGSTRSPSPCCAGRCSTSSPPAISNAPTRSSRRTSAVRTTAAARTMPGMGGPEGDVLAAAWPAAVDEILARVATIEDAVAALLGGALSDDERDGARRAAHRLAGTLGTFGIATGSVIARELETALETAPEPAHAPLLAERALALRRSVE